MVAHRLGRGACEYLPQLKLLISYWPMSDFTDDEWDGYVAAIGRLAKSIVGFRVVTWNAQNATPRPEQQQRMTKAQGGSKHKVAVVMRERPSGFASSVLAFVNPNIGMFSEQQWNEAWAHLGLTEPERLEAERALKQLKKLVEQTKLV